MKKYSIYKIINGYEKTVLTTKTENIDDVLEEYNSNILDDMILSNNVSIDDIYCAYSTFIECQEKYDWIIISTIDFDINSNEKMIDYYYVQEEDVLPN